MAIIIATDTVVGKENNGIFMYIPIPVAPAAHSTSPVKAEIEKAEKDKFKLLDDLRKSLNISARRANALAHYPAKTDDEKRYRYQALLIIAKFRHTEKVLNDKLAAIRQWPPSIDNIHPVLQPFYDTLPAKPYAAESKHEMRIKNKAYAWNKDYIQPNHPAVTEWIVIDVDHSNALYAHHDANAPAPQFVVVNPANGHAHLFYRLKTPVGRWGKSSQKAVMYLTAVYAALAKKLGGDMGYSGNICKNPNSDAWHTYTNHDAPASYDLGDLADWLDLPSWSETAAIRRKGYDETTAVGRNVSLFHGIRKQAYALAGQISGKALYIGIIALADAYNAQFDEPLPSNEVMHTVRSIYRYCSSARFKTAKAQSDAQFSALQARRGAKGGKASKRPPIADSEATTKPWESLGISRITYYRRKKAGKL